MNEGQPSDARGQVKCGNVENRPLYGEPTPLLLNQAREIERLRQDFGLAQQDLNLDLGPLGRLL